MAVYLVVLLSALTSISLRGSKVAVSLYALEARRGRSDSRRSGRAVRRVPAAACSAGRAIGGPLRRAPTDRGRHPDHGRRARASAGMPGIATCSCARRSWVSATCSFTCRCTAWSARSARKRSARAASPPSRSAFRSPLSSVRRRPASPSTPGHRRRLRAARGIAVLPARMSVHRSLIPARVRHEDESQEKSAFDLLAIPALRRTLIMSGAHRDRAVLVLPADLRQRHRPRPR